MGEKGVKALALPLLDTLQRNDLLAPCWMEAEEAAPQG